MIINDDYTIIGQLVSKDKIFIEFNNPKYERKHKEDVSQLKDEQIFLNMMF